MALASNQMRRDLVLERVRELLAHYGWTLARLENDVTCERSYMRVAKGTLQGTRREDFVIDRTLPTNDLLSFVLVTMKMRGMC